MMRKLIEMRSKTPPTVPIAIPNQDLIGIPLVETKGKEIGREEFDEESSLHQEPPPRAPIRGRIVFPDGGTARMEFRDRGGGVIDQYGRYFGQGEWTSKEGGGQAEPWRSGHVRRVGERWDSHPRYTGKTLKDHDNRYTGGGRSYWGGGDFRVRQLKMRMIQKKKGESSISDTQAPSKDKLIDKEGKEINLQS
ncbi:hypothetical protein IEQ34_012860 [Dendrobium chrysotoxum]|uniref:Uncharacterized protein n=1 Tax=Dendrobium chrysotoxum TaxID=161865 RepID=A0AAV7G6R9_DENCH|nr:hypothetical protein IEQ34_012860 [Dendrobium chrysotoxum]